MSVLGTVGSIAATVNSLNMQGKDEGLKGEFDKTFKNSDLVKYNNNIISLVNDNIINPVIVVSKSATRSEHYNDAVGLFIDMFVSYYLQAFQTLVDVYNLDKKAVINVLNKRTNGVNFKSMSMEGLLKEPPKDYIKDLISMEYLDSKTSKNRDMYIENRYGDQVKDILLKELDVEIPISKNGTRIKFRMLVRPRIVETTANEIAMYIAPSTRDKSFSERFMEWRSGGISFTDFVFATDLVKEYKKNKLQSNTDLKAILKTPGVSLDIDADEVGSLLHGEGFTRTSKINANHFAAKYNMFLFSIEDKPVLDKLVRGDIFKTKYKQDLLDMASGIMSGVLDDEYQKLIVGVSELYEVSKIDYKQLVRRKGGNNTDFVEMMKYLMSNTMPTTF